ncbi:unnamed protein product [Heligmosomoides polygyrus]|uniref:HTH psq-type domain-containing protein n=1 Tax=Heligmosomoides polygyrus TaxID=6339 RepID=A0A183G8J0_HELPZ|nr:unnamed protein product [Heligmosomoides polygyrus]
MKMAVQAKDDNTSRIRKIIKRRVDRNPKISMRKIARDIGISPSSVRRIARNELDLTVVEKRLNPEINNKDEQTEALRLIM